MFSVDVKVGRLLEIRLIAPVSLEDIQATGEHLVQLFQRHSGRFVCTADITRATVFPQAVAAKVLEVFKVDNPRLERSAILVSNSAIFGLQIERLIDAAENPARRCFHDRYELKAFLGSLLTHEEHSRLAQFLSER